MSMPCVEGLREVHVVLLLRNSRWGLIAGIVGTALLACTLGCGGPSKESASKGTGTLSLTVFGQSPVSGDWVVFSTPLNVSLSGPNGTTHESVDDCNLVVTLPVGSYRVATNYVESCSGGPYRVVRNKETVEQLRCQRGIAG